MFGPIVAVFILSLLRTVMSYAANYGMTIMHHVSDKSLTGDGVMNEGLFATILGLKGIPREAETIASTALYKADSEYSPYRPRRFDGYWIVPTINDDGWPGPNAVRIDTRTAATSFVSCPADRMLCGMERPVISPALAEKAARREARTIQFFMSHYLQR